MNIKRARRREARRLKKKGRGRWVRVDLQTTDAPVPDWMTRCYRNNYYTVMIEDDAPTTKGSAIKAMVQAHDDLPIPRHWREMQRIKNELFGEETTAIEYYPAQSDLVDDHNIYWLWVFPEGQLPIPTL